MPDLIVYVALLSGSLQILSFGDERLRCAARHIRTVSCWSPGWSAFRLTSFY